MEYEIETVMSYQSLTLFQIIIFMCIQATNNYTV